VAVRIPRAPRNDTVSRDFPPPAELFGVVTHKGRSADSGHYISWVRKREVDSTADSKTWLVFDDDSVTETETEYVVNYLKGGGDDHIAYLLFFKAKGGSAEEDAAATVGGRASAGAGKA